LSKKISKKDLKAPDQFHAELIKGFQWTTSHSQAVLGLVAVFVIAGAVYSGVTYFKSEKENTVQQKYYTFERQYTEKKAGFDQALMQKDKKDPKAPPVEAASGDLQKDYGTVVEGFESVLKEYPKTRGGQMAALNLSEIYANYKKNDDALRVLKAVEPGLGASEMLTALVYSQMGNIYADQNDCKQAIEQWQKIVDSKKLAFAQNEAKLRMGVCYESLNDLSKAEQMYTEASKKDEATPGDDMSASRDAEKYLKLLKMKKTTGRGS
jgi:tetratricopeptide (TPR) repeat protein